MPPKFSHSLKDLTSFLGIFEVSEEQINKHRDNTSETSSNLSHVTHGMFKAKHHELEVVHEQHGSDSEETENDGGDEREVHATTVGKIIKQSVYEYFHKRSNNANEVSSAE